LTDLPNAIICVVITSKFEKSANTTTHSSLRRDQGPHSFF